MARPRFDLRLDAGREMVAATEFTYNGIDYEAGDPFPIADLDPRRVSTLHGARRINFTNDRQQDARDARAARRDELTRQSEESPVKIEPQPGGYYQISAPWLAEPERVRGKAAAAARVEALTAEGPPLGFIDGGSAVTVKGGEGGWYDVNAPWLPAPEKVQGRELAETRQREIHEAGEPDSWGGVTLMAGEGGWWTITRPEFDGELKVQGEEQARDAAAKLRAGEMIDGQPVEWSPAEPLKEGDTALVGEDAGEPLAGKIVVVETIAGEDATVATYPDADDNVLSGTVALASLTAAERPTDEGQEGPADDPTADGAQTGDTAPAPELPEGGGSQTAETPPAGQSKGDDDGDQA